MIPAVIISCSCYTAVAEAEAAVTATTIDKLTVPTKPMIKDCTKCTVCHHQQQQQKHHCHHHHQRHHHHLHQKESQHCQQQEQTSLLYNTSDHLHHHHDSHHHQSYYYQQQNHVNITTASQQQQQQQQQRQQQCRRQRPSGTWHKRSHYDLTTYYLWWLFGICLIFSTNGGRNLNIGNLVMKTSSAASSIWSQSTATSFQSTSPSSSILAAASYLEPDELIHELDRPGK